MVVPWRRALRTYGEKDAKTLPDRWVKRRRSSGTGQRRCRLAPVRPEEEYVLRPFTATRSPADSNTRK